VTGTKDTYAGSWTYGYDRLDRVMNAAAPTGSVSYAIDPFGNKTGQTVTAGSGPAPSFGVNANNQLTGTGISYGGRGHMTADGLHTYSYDVENRLYSVDNTTCYAYDGDGDRVATTNCNVKNAGNGTTSGITAEFLYDTNHRLMTEINVSTEQMTRANIYAAGTFLAEDSPYPFLTNSSVATQLRITDQVGSLRGLTDLGNPNNLWSGAWSSFPYGDGTSTGDGGDSGDNPGGMLFTGKKRDPESGNDYFGARYYSSRMGRFLSPDYTEAADNGPDPIPHADLSNPQSFNLYAYVNNNPLSHIDVDGHAQTGCTAIHSTGSNGTMNVQQDCPQLGPNLGQAQQQSSSGGRFWGHVSNLFHGHSWNYGMRESVTVTISPAEPNSNVDLATSAAGLLSATPGAVPGAPGLMLGLAAGGMSSVNDPSGLNLTINGTGGALGAVSYFAEGTAVGTGATVGGFGVAAGATAWSISNWISTNIIVPVFTPDANQSNTINANGVTTQAPDAFDWSQP
jgi:RHS repeat-associated protein